MTTAPVTPGSIVVAVDGSEHAARALEWAAEQAHLEGRELVAVHASAEPDVARAIVHEAVDTVRRLRRDVPATPWPVVGDPREVLVEMSARAHLVVMGSRGRGVLRSMLLGSVSSEVSRRAACPVVVCRPVPAGTGARGVVVGVDGTPQALPVVELAFQQASLRGLPLTVVHIVWDVVAAVAGLRGVSVDATGEDELRLLLSESVAGLAEKYPDVEVDLRLAHGLIDEVLTGLADERGLVVVGRQPHDVPDRWISGPIATAVLERASCTVIVVPEAPADRT